MNNHKQLFLILTVAFSALNAGPTSYQFNPLKEIFANRPWEFVEDHFVLKTEKDAQRFLNKLKVCVVGVSSAIASGTAGWLLSENFVPEKMTKYDIPTQAIGMTLSVSAVPLVSGIAGAEYCSYLIKRMIDYKALESFLREWPENKFYTPEQFHSLFDTLYATYTMSTNKEGLKELSPEFVAKLQRAIYERFPTKYAHELSNAKENNSLHTVILFDLGEVLRFLGHIFNAFANNQRR